MIDMVSPQPDTSATEQHRRESIERLFAAIQAADAATLTELLQKDAITSWPQTGERLVGAISCINVYTNYPGSPPAYTIERITGSGDLWVAQATANYGDERWHIVSVIEFDGDQVARMTDYFGPSLPAPEWRREWVELEG